MRNRKNDIEKYLRGELSPAEMHALEKDSLSDPFLAEALEGMEHVGADNFLFDLHQLTKSVHKRARNRKNKTIKMWGWTVGIAASVILVAVSGFLVVSLLKSQKYNDLSMKEANNEIKPATDTIATALQNQASAPTATIKKPDNIIRKNPYPANSGLADRNQEAKEDPNLSVNEQDSQSIPAAAVPESPGLTGNEAGSSEEPALKSTEPTARELSKQSSSEPLQPRFTNRLLVGKVVSAEDATALAGVNVMVKGTNIGTVTDTSGNYQLLVSDDYSDLAISFIGYKSTEVVIGNKHQIDVKLSPDVVFELSEVIVTGYTQTGSDKSHKAISRLADPVGGRNNFKNYLLNAVRYPEEALKNKVQGRVTIRFNVEPDGRLTDFQVIQGIGSGCEDELIRLIKEGPAWMPTMKDNLSLKDQVKVRMRFTLPK